MPEGSTHPTSSAKSAPVVPATTADTAALMTGNANASNPDAILGDDADAKNIASLRKAYDDAAKAVTEATQYVPAVANPVDPKYIELRKKKQEAFEKWKAADDARSKRQKEAIHAQRSGQAPAPKTAAAKK